MRILISNDDGVYAPGIKALYQELQKIAEVTVVAPLEERSTTGHSIHLSSVLRLEKVSEGVYGCSGFPADCILMGLGHLMKGKRPDLVISGINRGANMGQDLYYSGTLAAAREATFHGVPSIGVSLNLPFNNLEEKAYYQTATNMIVRLVKDNIHQKIPPYTLLNVNVPNVTDEEVKGVKYTKIGFRKYSDDISARVDCRNREYFWIAGTYSGHLDIPGTDCVAVHENYVALTPHKVIDAMDISTSELQSYVENFKL
ncbi:MAG: 5'/3'-nucleotidase SurE [Bacteriovoracaceae bacterium]